MVAFRTARPLSHSTLLRPPRDTFPPPRTRHVIVSPTERSRESWPQPWQGYARRLVLDRRPASPSQRAPVCLHKSCQRRLGNGG